ncbi:MAG: hypothetical protein LC541_14835 [Candidatus Thiodiazotropha sp.]|nr:hypothetical protein [Candidatus Thiodiazotropha sp.]MCM8884545.1 hypothetical protein [Candidatus Thiodiazotropha sp.]
MTGRRVRMLALHPLWRKARRVYSLASRLPGTNRLGFQPSLALSESKNLWAKLAHFSTNINIRWFLLHPISKIASTTHISIIDTLKFSSYYSDTSIKNAIVPVPRFNNEDRLKWVMDDD